MGNRAVIAFKSMPGVGIYVHWNGGVESVLAFLHVAKSFARTPGDDKLYSFASLVMVISAFLGRDGTGIGVGPLGLLDTDNYDNGLFWVGGQWEIVKREYNGGDTAMMLADLDAQQRKQYHAMIESMTRQRERDYGYTNPDN